MSQVRLWRNYSLKGDVTGLHVTYSPDELVDFDVHVKDYLSSSTFLWHFDFSYSIDWESDGLIDNSLAGIRMYDELGQTDGSTISSGFKYQDLAFSHAYPDPGDYLITLGLTDRIETTYIHIPVHVTTTPAVPAPSSLCLVAFGLAVGRRWKRNLSRD